MRRFILISIGLIISVVAFSQEAIWEGERLISPEVNENQTVTFRLYAPQAEQVQVTGDFLPKIVKENSPIEIEIPDRGALIKGEHGVWEYTSPSLSPELYNYSFLVDGVKCLDPNNVFVVRDVASLTNLFLIKGEASNLYAVNDVPHGSVTKEWYYSVTLDMHRRMTIYTPPGYQKGEDAYPVLYLLHGMGGDEDAWITLGRAIQIIDNSIAEGRSKPMLIVMPNGNVSQEAAPGESSLGFQQPNFNLPKTMEGSMEKSFPDIVEYIEANYRVLDGKENRAIAGLSMGGFHSLYISLNYPELFNYVGLFSAATSPGKGNESPIYKDIEGKLKMQFQNPPKLYWVGIGKTDFLYQANVDFRALLDKEGLSYTYYESEGGHTWRNWRIYLSLFLPQLFR